MRADKSERPRDPRNVERRACRTFTPSRVHPPTGWRRRVRRRLTEGAFFFLPIRRGFSKNFKKISKKFLKMFFSCAAHVVRTKSIALGNLTPVSNKVYILYYIKYVYNKYIYTRICMYVCMDISSPILSTRHSKNN